MNYFHKIKYYQVRQVTSTSAFRLPSVLIREEIKAVFVHSISRLKSKGVKVHIHAENTQPHTEPRLAARSVLPHGVLGGSVGGRQHSPLGPCERDGQGGGGRRRRAEGRRRLSAAQHRPPGEAVGGELGPLGVVEAEGVESFADAGACLTSARVPWSSKPAPPARQMDPRLLTK